MTSVNVILTYYHAPQETMDIQISHRLSKLTEEIVLYNIFRKLPTKALANLIKISCAYRVDDDKTKLPKFIEETNGKFYFNIEDNLDAVTLRHCQMKLAALKHRL